MVNWDTVRQEAPEWFRDAKFGMFFHWGPYSVPACENEWYSRNMYARGLSQNLHHTRTYGSLHDFGYKDFYDKLKGEKFDADEWADLVIRAGAKYAGPVSEHADNFSLWDSRVNPVNSVNYGPGKDIVGLCAEAFRRRGIKYLAAFHHQWLWGWFMSTDAEADVYDPANEKYYWEALPLETNRYMPYRKPDARFNAMWLAKVEEVVKKYRPDAVYFDSRACIIDEEYRFRAVECIRRYTDNSPITYKQEDFPPDIGVYDIECGRFSGAKPFVWQTDDRLEDKVTWCIVEEPRYKSARTIIHQLCDVVSKNGSLLLNLGPRADGSFHPDAVKELEETGAWLRINGEAIYGARPYDIAAEGPAVVSDNNFGVEDLNRQLETGIAQNVGDNEFTHRDFRFTRRGDAVYAIALGWPADRKLSIRAFRTGGLLPDLQSVSLLGSPGGVTFTRSPEALEVVLPPEQPCNHAFVLKLLQGPV